MELLILLKLKWDIMVPTSKDFLLVLIKKLQQRKIVKNDDLEGIKTHANTFIDLILLGKPYRSNLRPPLSPAPFSVVPRRASQTSLTLYGSNTIRPHMNRRGVCVADCFSSC